MDAHFLEKIDIKKYIFESFIYKIWKSLDTFALKTAEKHLTSVL